MYVMAVNHDVEDYDRWKAGFDQYPPSKGGALFHRLNRNVDNPNNVSVVCGWNSVEDAIAFRDNPELKAKMGDAGVAGPPRFEIFEEVESVQY
jgi:heme-degrading monooxygenase HmoA